MLLIQNMHKLEVDSSYYNSNSIIIAQQIA